MKKFTHKFRNFDPLASSFSSVLGLRNSELQLVALPEDLDRFPGMVFDASRVIAQKAVRADVDGMSIKEWHETIAALFEQGQHFRNELMEEQRITWVEVPSYKAITPNFAKHGFVWTVDAFSKTVLDALPANRKHFWVAESCLGPLALSLLIIIDLALSALELRDEGLFRRLCVQADDFASRLKVIPMFAPQAPGDLSKIGADARHAADRQMAVFARALYQKQHLITPFRSLRAAAIALTPAVRLEAERIKKRYSGDFWKTVYRWLRDK